MISAFRCQMLVLVGLCVFLLLKQNILLSDISGIGKFSSTLAKIFKNQSENTEVLFYVEPRIDKSSRLDMPQIAIFVQRRNRYLPIVLWVYRKNKFDDSKGNSCVRFPNIYEQEFSNQYWQLLRTKERTFYLYGAYYDNRLIETIGSRIRILGMFSEVSPTVKTFCQMWFGQFREPVFAKVIEYRNIWMSNFSKVGSFQPYLMTCLIPKGQTVIPSSVSLVEKRCDQPKNNLRIVRSKGKEKENFAVCVKSLDVVNSDISLHLVQWIELLRILGAHKIFFYYFYLPPKMLQVLEYFAQKGLVDITQLTLPGGYPNIPKLRNIFFRHNPHVKKMYDLASINDCLYRNLQKYNYVIPLDLDEMILPTRANSWEDLLKQINIKARQFKDETPTCYCGKYVNFIENTKQRQTGFHNLPKYMHMLRRFQHSWSAVANSKCFHDPGKIEILHNNFPASCLGSCSWYPIDITDAKVQHYKIDFEKEILKEYVSNSTNIYEQIIWRYRSELINNTIQTLHNLKFLS